MYNMKEARIVTCTGMQWLQSNMMRCHEEQNNMASMGYCNHYRPIETHIETMLSWELGMPHPQNSHGPFDETIGQQVELLQKADNSSANAEYRA